jgi:hypothetical protein
MVETCNLAGGFEEYVSIPLLCLCHTPVVLEVGDQGSGISQDTLSVWLRFGLWVLGCTGFYLGWTVRHFYRGTLLDGGHHVVKLVGNMANGFEANSSLANSNTAT